MCWASSERLLTECGFLTTALLFVGEEGERAAQALTPQAFHGPGVPTPVLTVAGDAALRLHALAEHPWYTVGRRLTKGFVDEAWRRFLASLPIARSVAKFGYSFDRAEVEPCYIQPLLLEAREPSDEEIEQQSRQPAALSAVSEW